MKHQLTTKAMDSCFPSLRRNHVQILIKSTNGENKFKNKHTNTNFIMFYPKLSIFNPGHGLKPFHSPEVE